MGLLPDAVAVATLKSEDQKLDVEYWQDGQVDQLLKKVSWKVPDTSDGSGDLLSWPELSLIEQLDHGPIAGEQWPERRCDRTRSTAIGSLVVPRALNYTSLFIVDAVCQLDPGNGESVVLSARLAVGNVIDALLAGGGKYGQSRKWRARRLRAVEQDVISFQDYWAIETMQDFQTDEPEVWIRRVATIYRRVFRQVVV